MMAASTVLDSFPCLFRLVLIHIVFTMHRRRRSKNALAQPYLQQCSEHSTAIIINTIRTLPITHGCELHSSNNEKERPKKITKLTMMLKLAESFGSLPESTAEREARLVASAGS